MRINSGVALVGIGSICRSAHIPCLKAVRAHVIAGVDVNRQALDYFQKEFPRALQLTSLDKMPENVTQAVVASPVNWHYPQVKFLLNRGINVFCEKPLGKNQEEGRKLQELAKSKSLILQTGYFRRFHESSRWVPQTISSGKLGKLKSCRVYAGHNYPAGKYPPSIFSKELAGGGVFMDFGCHLIDRLLSWFGDVHLNSYLDDSSGGVEANCVVKLTAKVKGKQVPIEIHLSRTNDLGYFSKLEFEKETVRIDHEIGNRVLLGNSSEKVLELSSSKPIVSYFVDQWHEFQSRLHGDKPVYSSVEDAVRVNEIIDQCYAKRKPLHFVWEQSLHKYI